MQSRGGNYDLGQAKYIQKYMKYRGDVRFSRFKRVTPVPILKSWILLGSYTF